MKIPNKCDGNKLKINARHVPIPGTKETWAARDETTVKYDVAFCANCGLAFIVETPDQSKEAVND